jgi:hypothetical protein
MDDTDHSHRRPRINEQLQQYWHELRGDRPYPLESEVSPENLGDIWPACYLISVRDGKFAYDHLGAELVEAYGDNFEGREISEHLVYPHPESLFKTFEQVRQSGQPATDEGEFVDSHGDTVKYRANVLPLGARGREGVAFLLGGMKWKRY